MFALLVVVEIDHVARHKSIRGPLWLNTYELHTRIIGQDLKFSVKYTRSSNFPYIGIVYRFIMAKIQIGLKFKFQTKHV
jgi:hypothetical protein